MTNDAFKQGMIELYQGEVFGEVLFAQMLSLFDEPDLKYKISILLQLETETKAFLRPAMMQLGLDLSEHPDSRKMGLEMAATMKGKTWNAVMTIIREAVEPAIAGYKTIVDIAPPEYSDLAKYMLSHETAMLDFAELELADNGKKATDIINAKIKNQLSSV
jgi:hypothetical protein